MVADLVGQDIGACEVGSGGPKLGLHLFPEGQIQEDLTVGGAIEGAHGRLAIPTAGLGALSVDHNVLGRRVAIQLGSPDLVDVAADDVDELAGLIFRRALGAFLTGARPAELAGDLLGRGRVDAEDEIADQAEDDHADPAARDRAAAEAEAASILDIAATALSTLPAHFRLPIS